MMSTVEIFDVIVVGAGTAGCVLAERLTDSGMLPSGRHRKQPLGRLRSRGYFLAELQNLGDWRRQGGGPG